MKTNRLFRVLSLLGFLLLMAPFYDSCNGHRMKQADANAEATIDSTAVETDSILIDSTETAKTEVDTINNSVENYEPSFADNAYEFIDDEDSENAFEFAKVSLDTILDFDYEGLKKELKEGKYGIIFFELKNFTFILIVIVTLLILILSFENGRLVRKFSKLNLILLLITVFSLFLEGTFEQINQIKWGYYVFIITNLLIFYYSKRHSKGKFVIDNS